MVPVDRRHRWARQRGAVADAKKSRRALHRRLLVATAGSISGAIAIYANPASAWLMTG